MMPIFMFVEIACMFHWINCEKDALEWVWSKLSMLDVRFRPLFRSTHLTSKSLMNLKNILIGFISKNHVRWVQLMFV